MPSNQRIVAACGGSLAVAFHLNVHQVTVERWARGRRKIPEKYWHKLVELSKGAVTLKRIASLNAK